MKKIVILTVALFAAVGTAAAEEGSKGVVWYEGTLAQAKAEAAKEGKLVFLDCYADWCPACVYMRDEVFTQAKAGDYFNEKFVCIGIDMEKGEGPDLAKQLGIRAYPTFFVMDTRGNILGRINGGAQIDEFIAKTESFLTK